MIKVMVFGTFDTIHPGHIFLLKQAKQYGDYLIVVVSRDKTVCDIKTKPPRFDEHTRLQMVKNMNIADAVRLGCLGDKYQAVKEEDPDIIALGYDQRAFVDNLEKAIKPSAQIVRIPPYFPDIYKSSKIYN